MARSVIAEAIFMNLEPNIEVHSCGTNTISGLPMTAHSRTVLDENGYALDDKLSVNHLDVDLTNSTIVCMTKKHKEFMKEKYRDNNVFLLTELGSDADFDIEDPVRGDLIKYREIMGVIETEIRFFISKFR